MKKRDLFIAAMTRSEYRRKAWVITAFAIIQEKPDAWKTISTDESTVDTTGRRYPYRIVQTPTAYFFVDPDNNMELTKIDDAIPGQPLYGIKEKLELKAGDLDNLGKDVITTYGQALFNCIALINAFGRKIPYMQGRVKVADIENIILPKFADNPQEGETIDADKIYVSDYIKFTDSMMYLAQFTQLCVPAATKKTMLPAPGIFEYRAKLIEENKENLNDPTVIAKIDAALVAYDKAAMKGDLAEGFLISGKSYNIVRKKLYGMYGAEAGLTDKVEVDPVLRSLSEGWDISKFPTMNNAARAGSFNRGAQTQLGGEAVKWLLRASSNLTITVDDCGSVLGNDVFITEANYKKLIGFSIIVANKPVKIPDDKVAKTYIGKHVIMRTVMYCHLDQTDYCKTCAGDRLSEHPTALAIAVSQYGNAFLYIFMSAMHGKQLAVAKMDYKLTMS